MAKKIWVIVIIALIVVAVGAIAVTFIMTGNNQATDGVQIPGELGGHKCLALFRVERGQELAAGQEALPIESFKSFNGGAFLGKIKDFQAGQNQQFADLINQLMKEGRVATYQHLRADVCFYNQDLLNPENGANLDYYVEHYYCTNKCQTGRYEIRVNLDTEGNFVGYRQTENIY